MGVENNDEGTIFLVIKPPLKPILKNISIYKDIIEILIDKQNQITIRKNEEETIFQSVNFIGVGHCIFLVQWSVGKIDLRINGGEEFLLASEANSKVREIKLSDNYCDYQGIRIKNFKIPDEATEVELFFLSTIVDIQNKIESNADYDMIRAAGLLRQIFLDGSNSLLSKIKGQASVHFTITDNTDPLPLEPKLTISSLFPHNYKAVKKRDVNIDEFLCEPCYISEDKIITVKDIIKACANGKGGIHHGEIKSGKRMEEEKFVLEFDNETTVLGKEPSILQLRDICDISMIALAPLIQGIIKKYET